MSAALPPIVSTIAAMLMNSNLSGKGQLKHNLTPNELKCLNFMPFYRQVIDSDSDLSSLVSIVECMATGNRAFSEEFSKLLLQGVNQFTTYKSALAYMTVSAVHYLGCQGIPHIGGRVCAAQAGHAAGCASVHLRRG